MPPSAEQGRPREDRSASATPRAGQQLRRVAGPMWPPCDVDDRAAGQMPHPRVKLALPHPCVEACPGAGHASSPGGFLPGRSRCLIPLVWPVAPQPWWLVDKEGP